MGIFNADQLMKIIIRIFLLVLSLVAAIFAVSNREVTTIDLFPLPFTTAAPLYIFILGAMAIGLVIGIGVSSISKIRLKTKIRNQQKTKGEGKKDLENPIGPLDYIKEKTTT